MLIVAVAAGLAVGSLLTIAVTGAASIAVEPVLAALVTASLFVLMTIRFDETRAAIPAYWLLMAVLVAQTAIDLKTRRLPREITYWGIGLGGAVLAIAAIVLDEQQRIWMAVLGAAIALTTMWLISRFSKGGMGAGDVRLAPLLGLFLGWLNPGIVLPGLFFGFIAGAVAGLVMLASGRGGRHTALPFGPFLAAGTVVAILAGQDFVDLVLGR